MSVHRVCVFAGSSDGSDPAYGAAASALGRALAARRLGLVYGGARVGLMGAVADAVIEATGEVVGVIPQALAAREVAHRGLTDLRVVHSMHERKQLMADLSDAFVALPGGWGTLDELFEILTWAQLGIHQKPCALLNVRGYFDGLLAFLDHSIAEGFVREEYRSLLVIDADPEALVDRLVDGAAWEPPAAGKWIPRSVR